MNLPIGTQWKLFDKDTEKEILFDDVIFVKLNDIGNVKVKTLLPPMHEGSTGKVEVELSNGYRRLYIVPVINAVFRLVDAE